MSTPQPSFRPAAVDDVAALTALKRRAYEGYIALTGVAPMPFDADYGRLVAEAIVWLLAGPDGAPIGALVLQPASDHLLIYSVAVDPAEQGKGHGRRLMNLAEDEARRLGLDEIRLYTNERFTRNRAMYRRLGYEQTRVEQLADRRVVHMTKRLA